MIEFDLNGRKLALDEAVVEELRGRPDLSALMSNISWRVLHDRESCRSPAALLHVRRVRRRSAR
jgi:hypothetical protein